MLKDRASEWGMVVHGSLKNVVSRCQVTEFNAQQPRTRRQGGFTVIWVGLGMEGMADNAGGEDSKAVVSASLNDHSGGPGLAARQR